ncbi:MAG TPA: acyl-CoA dehydrogenase family protein [Deltaproteobacteria bacterium]|nr:acyl-CoA dehydrogenase family protein [Deltaproteobacteria bacterium]HPJ94304.1 acyl-CoA dehydrogenase family protein [Deltaproteobacteria bacterium]HPR51788.1 acyl-CoA dehydrogenase family protein [Deltaproteobacteria bacterium]
MDFSLTPEQKIFRDTVYRYGRDEIAPLCEEADLKGEFSFEIWNKLGEMGILGLPLPEELGGGGADIVTCCLAGEALGHAGVDGGSLLAWGAHTYLCACNIHDFGTEEQKRTYIPKLASGEWIGCMGLTEPGSGSDAASMRTTATKKGDRYILNGSKTFITNAPVADVFVVFANADRSKKHEGITAFIIEKDTPGLSTGKPFHKMGCRCSSTSEVFFEDCEVPQENVLGGEGGGWLIALSGVEWDRCTLLSPMLGAALCNLDLCARYANERHQFNRPIREFQAIQRRIADMKVFIEASRLAIYRVASSKDNGTMLNPLQAAVSKVYAGDVGFEMASEAVQVFGGYGFMHEYPVERNFRDSKLAAIGGGTSDIMRMIVSRIMLMQ